MRYVDPNIERKNLLQDGHLAHAPRLPDGSPIFAHVEFSICGLCNRTCIFCPRANPEVYPNKTEFLPIALYEKILGELADIDYTGRLSYSGFSEPFYHKRLVDMVAMTKRYLPKATIEIVTNGDMLTAAKLRALYDAGLEHLLVSMYDGPEQIEILGMIREDADVPADWLILRERYLPADDDFGITLSNRAGMVTELKDKYIQAVPQPMKHQCFYTHYRLMVDHTGEVLLCPHDWGKRLVAGNLNTENIVDVWRGAILTQTRHSLGAGDRNFAPCNLCDVPGTLQGRAHFDAWQEIYDADN